MGMTTPNIRRAEVRVPAGSNDLAGGMLRIEQHSVTSPEKHNLYACADVTSYTTAWTNYKEHGTLSAQSPSLSNRISLHRRGSDEALAPRSTRV